MEIFRVAPVHLVADWDVLRLFEIEPGSISVKEQQDLINRLEPLFSEMNMVLSYHDDLDWRLQLSTGVAVKTTPLHHVVGANVHDAMPAGDDELLWKRLLNEVQMLLHHASIGDLADSHISIPHKVEGANGIWVWREPSRFEKL
ncbi:MAG: hypothetical protein ISR71_02790, partial [Gammaproteobacteria bacterium]|nr:hypothetical protein [Gammaproteobacteria bacterium]